MAAASSLYGIADTVRELAPDLPVDKQDHQRANHRHDKAAEIKTIYTAKAEESIPAISPKMIHEMIPIANSILSLLVNLWYIKD